MILFFSLLPFDIFCIIISESHFYGWSAVSLLISFVVDPTSKRSQYGFWRSTNYGIFLEDFCCADSTPLWKHLNTHLWIHGRSHGEGQNANDLLLCVVSMNSYYEEVCTCLFLSEPVPCSLSDCPSQYQFRSVCHVSFLSTTITFALCIVISFCNRCFRLLDKLAGMKLSYFSSLDRIQWKRTRFMLPVILC